MYYSYKVVYIGADNAVGEKLCQTEELANKVDMDLLEKGFMTNVIQLEGVKCA